MTYPNAIWLGNPDIGYGGWGTFRPKWIIVHATAGDRTIENVAATFVSNKRLGNPSSTHFAVGMDGRVGQFVPEDQAAWGNGPITGLAGTGGDGIHHDAWWDGVPFGNPNSVTFSIEHCKADTANASPLTDAQKQASFALIAYLCDKYNIPKRWADAQGGITGHFSMDPIERSRCPGNYPWDELFAYLNGTALAGQPTTPGDPSMLNISQANGYFDQIDDSHWRCKQNGNVVMLGMLQAYRTMPALGALNGLTAMGLPLENEQYPKPGVATQRFERGTLVCDPHRQFDSPPGAQGDVYTGHVDQAAPAAPVDTSTVKSAAAVVANDIAQLTAAIARLP